MRPEQKRCLVLGGCGFIGSNLVPKLVAEGYRVRVFDMANADRANLSPIEFWIDFVEGNFLNEDDVDRALQDVDYVFHLVGTTLPANSNSNVTFDVDSNVLSTIRLLQASVRRGVKRVVFASSGGTVYGEPRRIPIPEDYPTNPLCSYGITKLMIEKYLRLFHHLYGLDYTILRIANPYGKYQKLTAEQGAVGVFLARINEGKKITIWGDGSVTRDYIYVDDVIDAFLKAVTHTSTHRLFNIGTGVGTSLRALLGKLERITGMKAEAEYLPGRPIDVSKNILDSTRANHCMNWHAKTDCDIGLQKTWDWVCESKKTTVATSGS